MKVSSPVRVGTSGWQYEHWRGPFYPDDLATKGWLAHYAARLHSVEVNRTFYSLPSREVFEGWRGAVPDDFRFAVKASRYITHMKKLRDPDEPVATLLRRARGLGSSLGPILFQLPPRWHRDTGRLAAFLEILPVDLRYAFELRDATWFDDEVYELLRHHRAAFCIWELAGDASPKVVTSDLVYVRLHGPAAAAYQGRYDRQTLAGWAGAFAQWTAEGRDVYCYFDNDQAGYAAINALELQEMVG